MEVFEKTKHEKKFGVYSGVPGEIALQVKRESKKFDWINDLFILNDPDQTLPLSNKEALDLLESFKLLQNIPDEYIEESLGFLNQIKIPTPSDFGEKIKNEAQAISNIKNAQLINIENSPYNTLSNEDTSQLFIYFKKIISREDILCSEDAWVRQAANDCLLDKDRTWRHIFEETQNILNKNKDKFLDKSVMNIPPQETLETIRMHLKTFFHKYKPADQIHWEQRFFSPKEIKALKEVTIDGHKIQSYTKVDQLNNRLEGRERNRQLIQLWANKMPNINPSSDLANNYHYFKDLCEPLEECLDIHKSVEQIKLILKKYPQVKQPHWTLEDLKKEIQCIQVIQANRIKDYIEAEFKNLISKLKPFENQKNQIAYQIIQSINNRESTSYDRVYKKTHHIMEYQKHFQSTELMKNKIGPDANIFFKKLQENSNDSKWRDRLRDFEKAWAWLRTKQWLEKSTNLSSIERKNKERKYLLKDIQENLEYLISEKAWFYCLSNMTSSEQEALKGWTYAISKIGKGTGKTSS